jgi:hypothetical protein
MTVLKLARNANSDGLIKCLPPARTVSQSMPKSMREKYKSSINFSYNRTVLSPGTESLAGGPTRWYLVFCSHRDYFIVTRNFTAIYLDLVPFRNFTVTRSSQPSTRTGKKHGTATQTAPN